MTMDETWIHHYTPETRRSSAELTAAGTSRPKWPKTQQWAGKVMASVFWDTHGILCNGRTFIASFRDCLVTLANRGMFGIGIFTVLDGKTDFTSACTCAVHEFYRPSTLKIHTPNIPRFANVIQNTPGTTRKMLFPCVMYTSYAT